MTSSGFTCPQCGMTSHHPKDVEEGYCGNCHAFTGPQADLAPEVGALLGSLHERMKRDGLIRSEGAPGASEEQSDLDEAAQLREQVKHLSLKLKQAEEREQLQKAHYEQMRELAKDYEAAYVRESEKAIRNHLAWQSARDRARRGRTMLSALEARTLHVCAELARRKWLYQYLEDGEDGEAQVRQAFQNMHDLAWSLREALDRVGHPGRKRGT